MTYNSAQEVLLSEGSPSGCAENKATAARGKTRSSARFPGCLGGEGGQRVSGGPCSTTGDKNITWKNILNRPDSFYELFCFQVRKSLMSGLAWTSYEAAVFNKKGKS